MARATDAAGHDRRERTAFGSVSRPIRRAAGPVALALTLIAAWLTTATDAADERILSHSDGAVWLRSTEYGGVTLHDSGDGAAITQLQVAPAGDRFEVAQTDTDAIVLNTDRLVLSRVNGVTWEIDGVAQLPPAADGLEVVAGPDTGWLLYEGAVTHLDLDDLALSEPIALPVSVADAIVGADGDLYLSSDDDSELLSFSRDGTRVEHSDVRGPATLLRLDEQIVSIDGDQTVWSSDDGVLCDDFPVSSEVALHAAGSNGTIVAAADAGFVYVWPASGGCPDEPAGTPGPGRFGTPVLAADWGVIPRLDTGEVLVVDLSERAVVTTLTLDVDPGAEIELFSEAGMIWYNDPAGPDAGLITPAGQVRHIEKYDPDAPGGQFAVPSAAEGVDGLDQLGELDPTTSAGEATGGVPADEDVAASADDDVEQPADDAGTGPTPPEAGSADDDSSDESASDEAAADPLPSDQETVGDGPTNQVLGPETDPESGTSDPTPIDPDTPSETVDDDGDVAAEDPNDQSQLDPEVSIRVSATSVLVGESIRFTAEADGPEAPTSYSWSFSPDSAAGARSGQEIDVVFGQAGQVRASVSVCFADRPCLERSVVVDVYTEDAGVPLEPRIQAPRSIVVGTDAVFVDASAGDPETWSWSAQAGSPATGDQRTFTTTWSQPGTFSVELVIGRGEETERVSIPVEVQPATQLSPILRCGASSMAVGEQVVCRFDDLSAVRLDSTDFTATGGTVVQQSQSQASATIEADRPGTLTVTAAWSGEGQSDSASISIQVEERDVPDPVVDIVGPTTAVTDEAVRFSTTNSGGEVESYEWTFDGGSPSTATGPAPTVRWSTPGTKTVTVVATGANGTTVRATASIDVDDDLPPLETRQNPRDLKTNSDYWKLRSIMTWGGTHAEVVSIQSGDAAEFNPATGEYEHTRRSSSAYNMAFTILEFDAAGNPLGYTAFRLAVAGQDVPECSGAPIGLQLSSFYDTANNVVHMTWTTAVQTLVDGYTVTPNGPSTGGDSVGWSTSRTARIGDLQHTGAWKPQAGVDYLFTVTVRDACGTTDSASASFTGTGEAVDYDPPQAITSASCSYQDFAFDASDTWSWREQWTWNQPDVSASAGYEIETRGGRASTNATATSWSTGRVSVQNYVTEILTQGYDENGGTIYASSGPLSCGAAGGTWQSPPDDPTTTETTDPGPSTSETSDTTEPTDTTDPGPTSSDTTDPTDTTDPGPTSSDTTETGPGSSDTPSSSEQPPETGSTTEPTEPSEPSTETSETPPESSEPAAPPSTESTTEPPADG